MHAGKDRLYINEPVPLTIKLYISGLSVRDIQYPEFSYEGFSTEQLGKPKQYQERKGSLVYDVVEFNTEIFGTKVGTFSLGPATIQANLFLKRERRGHSDGFFGRDPFEGFFGGYRTEPIESQMRLSSPYYLFRKRAGLRVFRELWETLTFISRHLPVR
jgi:hypothetical protein